MNYILAGQICKQLQISYQTLKNWKDSGKIKYKVLGPHKILYDIESVLPSDNTNNKLNVIYARVSTTKQKQDLINQINLIKSYMIANGYNIDNIYQEIASGLNDNRLKLNELLQDISENKIAKVFISYKDRLTLLGFGYFKEFCRLHNTEIIVLDDTNTENKSNEQEMIEDLISIIHHYSTKLYSDRKKKIKNIEKQILSDFSLDK